MNKELLQDFRQRYGLSVDELAGGAKVTPEFINKMEATASTTNIELNPDEKDQLGRLMLFMVKTEAAFASETVEQIHPPCALKESKKLFSKYVNSCIEISRLQNGYVVTTPFPKIYPPDPSTIMELELTKDYLCKDPDELVSVVLQWACGRTLKQIRKTNNKL